MSLPTLSVAIPHYNHGRYVRQAVEAILAQSFPPLEVVIVDDGSTDGSQSLLDELAVHARVRVVHNDRNRGVGYTSNRGLSLCRGDYVCMTAADDLVQPGFFAWAIAMARQHPTAGIIFGKMAMTDEAGAVRRVFEASAWRTARFASPRQFLREFLEKEDPSHSLCAATIYRREPFQALGGYRTDLGHWMDTFIARAIGLRHGVCYAPEIFMHWRYSAQGFCGSRRWEELVRVVRRAAALMRSPPFCEWFPESHAAWWEQTSLDNLFHSRIMDKWPLLKKWSGRGGLRARVAHRWLRVLARLSRWRWERMQTRPTAIPEDVEQEQAA